MPSPETLNIKEHAVRWPKTSVNEFNESLIGDPEEIKVRWEDGFSDPRDAQATKLEADATIYFKASQTMGLGDIVWYGKLVDLTVPPVGLFEVVGVWRVPDFKGRKFSYKAALKTYTRNTLPSEAP